MTNCGVKTAASLSKTILYVINYWFFTDRIGYSHSTIYIIDVVKRGLTLKNVNININIYDRFVDRIVFQAK